MKKSLLTVLAITLLALTGGFAMAQTFNYPMKGRQGFNLTEKTRDGLHISYNLGQMSLSQLNYRGEERADAGRRDRHGGQFQRRRAPETRHAD